MIKTVPFITIYCRHGKIRTGPDKGKMCPHAGTDSKKEEQSFLDCRCRKHLSWTDPATGKQIRRSARTRSKDEANNVKTAIEKEMRGEAPDPETDINIAMLLTSAVKIFIAAKTKQKRSSKTINNYCACLARLQAFSDSPTKVDENGVTVPLPAVLTLSRITNEFLQHFADTWDTFWPSRLTQKLCRGRLACFFNFCVRRGWINRAPSIDPIEDVNDAPTLPLTQEQVVSIFAAIPVALANPVQRIRVENLITLQLESGLAIIDAVTLPKSALKFNSSLNCYVLKTNRTKTGRPVHGSIEVDIVEKVFATPNNNPDYLFWSGKGAKRSASAIFGALVTKVFVAAGVAGECYTKSHRLRDTFAVRLLAKGVSIPDLAEALGDTIAVTEKSYAKWLPEREHRIYKVIADTFAKPLLADSTAAELEMLARLKAKYEPPPAV